MSRQPRCLFPGHCGSVKQDNKRYFILYLKLASCEGRPAGRNEVERIKLNFGVGGNKKRTSSRASASSVRFPTSRLSPSPSVSLPCSGMPDIQWMNLDPVKLMEELSQFTSLEGFKEMLDKAQVGCTITHSQIYGIKRLFYLVEC